MNRSKRDILIDTLLLLVVIGTALYYFALNQPTGNLHILRTPLDPLIPRVAVFSVPYLAFLPFFWGTVIYSWATGKAFRPFVVAVVLTHVVAYTTYVLFQTHVPRDPVVGADVFSNMLRWIYSNDRPYNGFPSLHSALSAVSATYFVLIRARWRWFAVAFAALVVASTLLVKQHFVPDAVSGVALGAGTMACAFFYLSSDGRRRWRSERR